MESPVKAAVVQVNAYTCQTVAYQTITDHEFQSAERGSVGRLLPCAARKDAGWSHEIDIEVDYLNRVGPNSARSEFANAQRHSIRHAGSVGPASESCRDGLPLCTVLVEPRRKPEHY
jgi:hypothetical protein